MAAIIELPDGTRATLQGYKWTCSDPKAIPVLEFFSKRVDGHVHTNPASIIANGVVKVIVGSRLIHADPTVPLPPGAIS
jgi:hypothetical protein